MIPIKFSINGFLWNLIFVDSSDIRLIDRTGNYTVATTDPSTMTVCVSDELHGDFLRKVTMHELGHCVMLSTDLLDYIHRNFPDYLWIDLEEFICNVISEHSDEIIEIADYIMRL